MLFPIDHGNSAMKTVNFVFPSGLIDNPIRPPVDTEMLEYDGKFWTLSGQRISYMRDKTKDERYWILTLFAIAKELEHRGAEHTASVHLAAGLPLTSFGRDKKSFRSYLYRDGSAIPFRYEGQDYTVTIQEVSLFPPGLCRRTDPDGTAGRAVRHCGGHWRLDGGSDAA